MSDSKLDFTSETWHGRERDSRSDALSEGEALHGRRLVEVSEAEAVHGRRNFEVSEGGVLLVADEALYPIQV